MTTYGNILGPIVGTLKVEMTEEERRLDHYGNYQAFMAKLHEKNYLSTELKQNDAGSYLDRWGNPITIIFENGIAVGAGSNGENQVWDHGMGDDIVLFIDARNSLDRLYPSPLFKFIATFGAGVLLSFLMNLLVSMLKNWKAKKADNLANSGD